jgi:hypothetical protein
MYETRTNMRKRARDQCNCLLFGIEILRSLALGKTAILVRTPLIGAFYCLLFVFAGLFHASIVGINIASSIFAGRAICNGGFVAIDLTAGVLGFRFHR